MVAESAIFIEISLMVIIAVVVSSLVRALRQPAIIGYILAGIIVSPYFLDLVKSAESVTAFAQIGVSVLLFMVGLNLNPKVIKEVGKVAVLTGIGQIIFTTVIAFFIAKILGFTTIVSLYIGLALSFSSTIIIMKLLSDKGETETLYGKISIAFLIVQDLVAILLLMIVSSIGSGNDLSTIALQRFGTGFGLVLGLGLIGYFVLPSITKLMAKSQELLLLFSVGWALALASLFNYFGFSIEIGALLAGISLSNSTFKYEISAKMKPLRDFFILMFFILIGSSLNFDSVGQYIVPAIIFSVLVFFGNPLIVMTLMGAMGYTKRNSFLSGLTVSQISEFSFILISLAVAVGHVPIEILSMITIVGIITMAASSYVIIGSKKLYEIFSDHLGMFERRGIKVDHGKYHQDKEYDIIMFGYNRIGYSLVRSFKKMKRSFLIIDNNPDTVVKLAKMGIDCRYGDAEDTEMLDDLPLKQCKIAISTIPDLTVNLLLTEKLNKANKGMIFIPISHQIDDALSLYNAGSTYVLTPHLVGGDHTAHLLDKYGFGKERYSKERDKHVSDLKARKKEGHRDLLHERD